LGIVINTPVNTTSLLFDTDAGAAMEFNTILPDYSSPATSTKTHSMKQVLDT